MSDPTAATVLHGGTGSPTTARGQWLRSAARWMVTFVGFPAGGLAAMLIVGPVDSIAAALAGGLVTGAIIGVVQAWGLRLGVDRGRGPAVAWVAATAIGLMVGLGIGATAVDFGTSLTALVIQGAICGLIVGAAQAFVLQSATRASRPALAPRSRRDLGDRVDGHHRRRNPGRGPVHRLRLVRRHHRHRHHRSPARDRPPHLRHPHRKERIMTRHVVFGTGQVGRHVVEQLVSHGIDVTAVNRSGRGDIAGAQIVAGDATDPAFTREVSAGADAVYFCLNATNYAAWAEEFPPLQRGVLAGAEAAGARLVVLDNLYAYGPTDGRPLVETMPGTADFDQGRHPGGDDRRTAARRTRPAASRSPSAEPPTTSGRARRIRRWARRSSARR